MPICSIVGNAVSSFYHMGRPKLQESNFKFSNVVMYETDVEIKGCTKKKYTRGALYMSLKKCPRSIYSPHRFNGTLHFSSANNDISYNVDFQLKCHKKQCNQSDLENILHKRVAKYDSSMDAYVNTKVKNALRNREYGVMVGSLKFRA